MSKHQFEGFIIELDHECKEAPMRITIDNAAGFSISLARGGAFHFLPVANSGVNEVIFKSSSETAVLSFHLTNAALEKLKNISLLPVYHNEKAMLSPLRSLI